MKEEQAQLEKRLWDERQAIEKKHEEKVRVAGIKYAHCPFIPCQVLSANKSLQGFALVGVSPLYPSIVLVRSTSLPHSIEHFTRLVRPRSGLPTRVRKIPRHQLTRPLS